MRQRPASASRMPGFWELPEASDVPEARAGAELGRFRHTITHHLYLIHTREAAVARTPRGMQWVDPQGVPLATTARKALHKLKVL
jgi:hypothetical protein